MLATMYENVGTRGVYSP